MRDTSLTGVTSIEINYTTFELYYRKYANFVNCVPVKQSKRKRSFSLALHATFTYHNAT